MHCREFLIALHRTSDRSDLEQKNDWIFPFVIILLHLIFIYNGCHNALRHCNVSLSFHCPAIKMFLDFSLLIGSLPNPITLFQQSK